MTAMTVTVAGTTRTSLAVIVLTNAAASQPGRTATDSVGGSGPGANSLSITPEDTGSLIYGAFMTRAGKNPYGAFSAATTFLQDCYGSNGAEVVTFVNSSPTTGGTPVTLGVNTGGNELSSVIALCEIIASGTLTVDPSTPAPVPGNGETFSNANETTASFNPPSNALLLAIAGTEATSVAISDSLGLTWTQQVSISTPSTSSIVTIWTATLGPPPANPGKVALSQQVQGFVVNAQQAHQVGLQQQQIGNVVLSQEIVQ